MSVKAIFFDLDDTLHDHLDPFSRTIKVIFPEYYLILPMLDLYKKFRHYSDLLWTDYSNNLLTLEQLRIQRISLAIKDYELTMTETQAHHFQLQYDRELKNLQLFSKVPELLVNLAQTDIKIGIITNGPVEHQYNKIRSLGLLNYITEDYIFISDGVGIAKPNPDIFHFVKNKMEMSAENILYVGDSWYNDVVAPLKAGWNSVWYNHRRRNPETENKPIAEITNLLELLEVLSFNEKRYK